MDCLFNKQIPDSTPTRLILRPNSKTFINGIASSYEIIYYEELKPYVRQIEYNHHMTRIIEGLTAMWPCIYCFSFGYICSLCTLGLSFCLPNICISEAVEFFTHDIEEVNSSFFNKNKLHLSLQRRCCTSWLQIDILDSDNNEEQAQINNNTKKKEDNSSSEGDYFQKETEKLIPDSYEDEENGAESKKGNKKAKTKEEEKDANINEKVDPIIKEEEREKEINQEEEKIEDEENKEEKGQNEVAIIEENDENSQK